MEANAAVGKPPLSVIPPSLQVLPVIEAFIQSLKMFMPGTMMIITFIFQRREAEVGQQGQLLNVIDGR